jgi:hypothetical protein
MPRGESGEFLGVLEVPEDPGGEGKFVTREPIEVGVFTWARIQQLNDAYPAGLP